MSFVSHAKNFEDVLLWRALRAAAPGLYIDIGAGPPATGSVTEALSERGWHGVNLTIDAAALAELAAQRPRDLSLPFSAETLNSSLRDLGRDAEVHLLRIAIAPAEPALPELALDVLDALPARPWIILLAQETAASAARASLEHARYRFVWFDGEAAFFVAEERAAALAPHFAAPPNSRDDFVPVESHRLAAFARQATSLQADIATLRAWHAADRQELAALREKLETASAAPAPETTPAPPAEHEPAATEPGMTTPPSPPPPPPSSSLARRLARAAYCCLRPILRPLAWRGRNFLMAEANTRLGTIEDRLGPLLDRQNETQQRLAEADEKLRDLRTALAAVQETLALVAQNMPQIEVAPSAEFLAFIRQAEAALLTLAAANASAAEAQRLAQTPAIALETPRGEESGAPLRAGSVLPPA